MTKEDLFTELDKVSGMGNVSVNTMRKLLNKFFDSNICIPKGTNRHIMMYADIDAKYAIYSDGRLLNKELAERLNIESSKLKGLEHENCKRSSRRFF